MAEAPLTSFSFRDHINRYIERYVSTHFPGYWIIEKRGYTVYIDQNNKHATKKIHEEVGFEVEIPQRIYSSSIEKTAENYLYTWIHRVWVTFSVRNL